MTKSDDAWKDVANSVSGRAALADLFRYCQVYDENFPADPMRAGMLIGMRNVAAYVARSIGREPETFEKDATEDLSYVEQMLNTKHGDYIS